MFMMLSYKKAFIKIKFFDQLHIVKRHFGGEEVKLFA
ncbi:hypothetical protein BWD121_000670 [Bartonella sp. WD12.1]|nr:hypothetical protein BWD121_000670 [Bartonella sp. WD12.1]